MEFLKKISAFIYTIIFEYEPALYVGYELTQSFNGEDVDLAGIEGALQFQYSFQPEHALDMANLVLSYEIRIQC